MTTRGERLRQIRQDYYNASIPQFAELLGVTTSKIISWENTATMIRDDNRELRDFLVDQGFSWHWLLTGEYEITLPDYTPVKRFIQPKDLKKLISRVPESRYGNVLEFLETQIIQSDIEQYHAERE